MKSLKALNFYLWADFWKAMGGQLPKYGKACDTMRIIEGEADPLRDKILIFPFPKEFYVCPDIPIGADPSANQDPLSNA